MTGPSDDTEFDILIIGAGIAGAALAYFAAPHARVALLEREAVPGLHATGRSAAMFMESYGPDSVRALTRASRAFLEEPQADGRPLIAPRGALYIATQERIETLHALHAALRTEGAPAHLLDRAAARAGLQYAPA